MVSQTVGPKVKPTYSAHHIWLRVSDIEVEPMAQRKYNPAWAREIASKLDPDLLGLPFVAELSTNNGHNRHVVIDGQHRIKAVALALGDDQRIECEVVRGIDLQRAAQLYRGRNKIRLPRVIDTFLAGVTAKDPECIAINQIAEDAGFHIAPGVGSHYLSAVGALLRVYRMGPANEPGGYLRTTLALIVEAWGYQNSALGDIIIGLGMFLRRYTEDIDMASLSKKLAASSGGALGLLGRGRKLNEAVGRGVPNGIAQAITMIYNSGRSKHELPEWGSRENAVN